MSGHSLEGHKYQEQVIPQELRRGNTKSRTVMLRVTLPSQDLLDKLEERRNILNMTLSKYITWVLQKELLKDPRKQYDKLYNL